MSFHSDLVANWPADLVTAGVIALAAQAYSGDLSQKIRRADGEAWIERRGVAERGSGLQALRVHEYGLHLRLPGLAGPDRTGRALEDAVEAKIRTLVDRYHGARPFSGVAALGNLVASECVEEFLGFEDDDHQIMRGSLAVTFLVKG